MAVFFFLLIMSHAVKEDEMVQQSSDLFCYNLDKIDLPVFQ